MLVLAFAFVLAIAGTSTAALNETSNQTNISATATADYSGSDPIISGTVTVNEYDHVRPLEGASVIVNSTSGNVLASTTTDANGHYSLNFFSTDLTFNVIVSYIGCNSITHSVTVTNGPNYPIDPNKYGTSNFELTPKEATLTGTGNGETVYIQGQNKNGFAGVINVRVGSTTYTAYCIDLFTPISIGDTLLVNGPLPGTAGDLPSEVDWGKVSYILNTYNPSSDTEAAAIQCAIWYFTSVHYGSYNPSSPIGTYYQYMTAPNDGKIGGAYGSSTVRNRAWEIINAAISMQYPYSIEVTPEQTTVANDQTITITATVRDINGNPLQGVTVNFQRTLGTLSRYSSITNALGQVFTTLTLGDNSNSLVTAYVSGNYGNLLYDDATATTRKQNLVARNVLPLTISAFSIINTARTADVTLTQTATPATVNVGDTVTYVVTATNANQRTATGIMISDIIPAGLSGVTVTASSGTTYYNGMWTIPSLNRLTSATLTITGIATAQMAGLTTTNTATRIAQEQYNSMPASVSAGVYTKKADVAVTQTVNGGSSATANVGDTITYVINAVNNGPDAATNLRITDLLPSGLTDGTYTITGPGTYNLGTGLWNIGTLNSGATAILTITGKVTAAMAGLTTTNYANRTTQTEYNTRSANTSTTVYTKLSDPIITQTVNGQSTGSVTVNVGDTVTYVVNAYCSGPDDATNIQIRDIVPAGLENITVTPSVGTYDPNTGIWTISFLEKYTSATLTITGKAGTNMAGTTRTNRATEIFQTEYNPYPGDSTSIPAYTTNADITLETYAYSKYNAWHYNVEIPFITSVKNNAANTANNIVVEINIPINETLISVNLRHGDSYEYNETTRILTWIISTLPGKQVATLEYTLLNKNIGTLDINSTAKTGDQTTTSNWTINTPNAADVEITQQASNYNPTPGEIITITITAKNNGPSNASGYKIQNTIPSGLTLISATPSKGTYSNGIWNLGTLSYNEGIGETATLTLQVQYNSPTANNAYRSSSTTYDWVTTNSGSTIIFGSYTPETNITTDTYAYSKYNAWHYNVEIPFITSVKNNAANTANNIVVEINIPINETLISVNLRHGDSYEYNETTRILTWIISTLPGKQVATLEYTLLNKNIGTLDINSTAKTGDQTTTSNWTINTPNAADVEITQQASNYNPTPGEIITITITAKNNGPSNASGYKIQNTIPSGLTLISATPSKGTYSNGIWNLGTLSYNEGIGETATLTLQVQYNSPTANNAYRSSSTTYDWVTTNSGSTQYP
ncbi:Ig-like domain-containing protein [Methanobacterium sp.]|uniref:Ig-like domain-containing protein n=1 Tax=Methanobacterium sp. TaxID=2164 RepID=UPI002AB89256|nr:Ig-like domain-containing protein [Methanobacterium sp.]MDY9922936.1 Ig-like domain-containing protein [Methanobacterium sp.]